MTDLHYRYRLGISTILNIIRQVWKAIWERVKPICFPEVTERFWLETAAQFYQRTDFPHCLGALDGKHIRVIKPEKSGSLYYNYKNFFSILLLAVCDASYKFVFIDVGAYGKSSDSTVFKESVFFRNLESHLYSWLMKHLAFPNTYYGPVLANFWVNRNAYLITDFHELADTLNAHLESLLTNGASSIDHLM